MSDHISGPRALADPIADITDVYAFAGPEQPQNLVLVMNTLPFAQPSSRFSDGLIYRFRLRPLTRGSSDAGEAPFAPAGDEVVIDTTFSGPMDDDDAAWSREQQGTCTLSTGGSAAFRVGDPEGGSAPAVRAFGGVRWDPFIMDARAALDDDRNGGAGVHRPRGDLPRRQERAQSRGRDRSWRPAEAPSLMGVVAETLTRGRFNVRIERVGRPEVKNMMLAPKQFDAVNRDLEIRDLYNMEDAFHLEDTYLGAYRARLNANLAFWDGLDGKVDWPPDENGDHPLTDLMLADFLVVDVTKPYVEHGSYLEIELAARRGGAHADLRGTDPQRRRDRHAVHAAGECGERAGGPRRGRPRDQTRRARLPLSRRSPIRTRRRFRSTTDERGVKDLDRDHGRHPRARRHPARGALRTALALRGYLPPPADPRPRRRAASWSGDCTGW